MEIKHTSATLYSLTVPYLYTSRGHRCGFYSELIFVESKALKQAHSELCNCFSNAAIGKNEQIENCNGGRAKYIIGCRFLCVLRELSRATALL